MPTSRTYTVTFLSILLYLFANQTQVGWLYVMSALLAGLVFTSLLINLRSLEGIEGQREIKGEYPELYEGDHTAIRLIILNKGKWPKFQLRAMEICPVAPPDSEAREMNLFIPRLPKQGKVVLDYEVTLYRRGVYSFSPVEISSRTPFGLFQRKKTVEISNSILVYPELRQLKQLEMFDRQPSLRFSRPRAGSGTEVMGVRPFRTGDSPRHIHWRSVARKGVLISKEFTDEAQPGLTLAIDLYPYPFPNPEHKHTPFEWAIKTAASIADYAQTKGYMVHLFVDETAYPVPFGPVTRTSLMTYLAKVQPTSMRPLHDLLDVGLIQSFAVVLLPWVDKRIKDPLLTLRHQGIDVLAVLMDPRSFPEGGPNAWQFSRELNALGVETRVIQFGKDWVEQIEDKTPIRTLSRVSL